MAASTLNGAFAVEGNGPASKMGNAPQQQAKNALSSKPADGAKKGDDNPQR
jgi:hypothetical protein